MKTLFVQSVYFLLLLIPTNAYSHLEIETVNKAELTELLISGYIFVGGFPHFILSREATIFDVCNDDGKFKVMASDKTKEDIYVRSTYKKCTRYQLESNDTGDLFSSCKRGAFEEVPIPLTHNVPLLNFYGENIQEDDEYKKMIVREKYIFGGIPQFFILSAAPYGENFYHHRNVNYEVPDCK